MASAWLPYQQVQVSIVRAVDTVLRLTHLQAHHVCFPCLWCGLSSDVILDAFARLEKGVCPIADEVRPRMAWQGMALNPKPSKFVEFPPSPRLEDFSLKTP